MLAAVLGQLAGPQAQPEGAEAAAGVNRRQLPVIPNQDHLGVRLVGVLEETGERAAAQHASLVHHQHRLPVQSFVTAVQVSQQPVASCHFLEPLCFQADGRDPGRGGGQEPVAVQLPGMPGHPQGEGLASPGPADDHRDAGAALADVVDHRPLVVAGGGVGGQGGPDAVAGHHGGLLAGSVDGSADQALLDGQQLGGGPATLLHRSLDHHGHRLLGQEPVGELLELSPGGAGELAAEGSDHVVAGEGGRGRGQPVRTDEPVEHFGHRMFGQCLAAVDRPAGHLPDEAVHIHAPSGRLRPPPSIQGVRSLVLLGLAGRVDSPLDQPRRPLTARHLQPLDLQVDLVGTLGEQPHQVVRDAGQLAVAVAVRWRPLHPERPDKLALVAGPIDRVHRQPVPVQVPAVQRRPASVRALDPVGHHQVGVQQRIPLPGRAVVEPDRQQPLSAHMLDTTMATTGAQMLIQIGDCLADADVVGVQYGSAGHRVAQAVQDRHALGRPQHHIERRHGPLAVGAAQQLSGVGVAALEHGLEPRHRCFALQPKASSAGAVPAARGLTVARQILLVVGGQLAGVVRLPAHRELGDIGHHPPHPSPPVLARTNAPVVHCSPET